MASFILGGDLAFNAVAYGAPTEKTLSYFKENFNFKNLVSNEFSNRFVNTTKELFDKVNNSNVVRSLRAIGRNFKNTWQPNAIMSLNDIGSIQNSSPVMQRWIMADPFTRDLYLQQRLDGFSHNYVNNDGSDIGESHSDYRKVMNGILIDIPKTNDNEESWLVNNYNDGLLPDDDQLTSDDQFDIIKTWNAVRSLINKGGDDPTSIYNSSLD